MLKSEPLYYLVELAHCNSYRIASENLHITQPALSIAIKKLEAELGVILIKRSNRAISLTTAGEQIVMMSERALAHLDEIEHIRESTLTGISYDHLTIYTFPAISQSVLLSFLTDFQQEISLDKLTIKDVPFSKMMELLSGDEYGFALAWQLENDQRVFTNINHHKLCSAQAELMLSPKSELIADDVSRLALKDIMQLPLVSYEGGYGINNLLFERMRACYGSPTNVIEVPNMVLFKQVINSGMAVALGANLSGWKSARESGFTAHNRFVPIEEDIVFDFNLYYHRNLKKALRDYIIATLEKNMF